MMNCRVGKGALLRAVPTRSGLGARTGVHAMASFLISSRFRSTPQR
jgi:hypothetical protein